MPTEITSGITEIVREGSLKRTVIEVRNGHDEKPLEVAVVRTGGANYLALGRGGSNVSMLLGEFDHVVRRVNELRSDIEDQ